MASSFRFVKKTNEVIKRKATREEGFQHMKETLLSKYCLPNFQQHPTVYNLVTSLHGKDLAAVETNREWKLLCGSYSKIPYNVSVTITLPQCMEKGFTKRRHRHMYVLWNESV